MVRLRFWISVGMAATAAIFVLPALHHELNADEVESPPAVELDAQVDLFVDMIYHNATRRPMEVRHAPSRRRTQVQSVSAMASSRSTEPS